MLAFTRGCSWTSPSLFSKTLGLMYILVSRPSSLAHVYLGFNSRALLFFLLLLLLSTVFLVHCMKVLLGRVLHL